jgi:hypothetical protein
MARRKKSLFPKLLLLAVLCLAGGGLIAVLAGGGNFTLPTLRRPAAERAESKPAVIQPTPKTAGNPASRAEAAAAPADGALAREVAERKRLEAENARLQRTIDARDREIADLMIQVKLLTEGSRLPEN